MIVATFFFIISKVEFFKAGQGNLFKRQVQEGINENVKFGTQAMGVSFAFGLVPKDISKGSIIEQYPEFYKNAQWKVQMFFVNQTENRLAA